MNQPYRCVIVDDEELATKVLLAHLKQVPNFECVGVYHSAVDAFLALEKIEPDVLFLDIQMPKMTGISMLRMLKEPPLTVFTTAHREYALEGYELEVIDYLLKPISLARFLQTINRLNRLLETNSAAKTEAPQIEADHIFIKTNRTFVKIDLPTIEYVEAIKNHIRVVTTEASYISLMPLSEFESKLPENSFLRIHRSFIINLEQVQQFDNNSVKLPSKTLSIGRSYKDKARQVLQSAIK